MKRLKMILCAVLVVCAASGVCRAAGDGWTMNRVKGNGRITTRTVKVGRYDAIEASRGVKVVVCEGVRGAEIRTDENLQQYVQVSVSGGELEVTISSRISVEPTDGVVVRVADSGCIERLEASSAGKIVIDKPLSCRSLELEASSAGKIRVDARVGECEIDASSAAQIAAQIEGGRVEVSASSASTVTLQGAVSEVELDASSAAKIRAGKLKVRTCEAEASSGADITVYCVRELDSRTGSGGSVRYYGNPPIVRSHDTSGGSTAGAGGRNQRVR
ncbi:MAG: DUF2807 domain-containing protein [Alistipes sp.]|nr:DUF2807 domain-containing protein [Alistipes sp.]